VQVNNDAGTIQPRCPAELKHHPDYSGDFIKDGIVSGYQRIIDADRESMERLGHGNALAQSYNHTILPLDNQDDARTQIRWGLQDFGVSGVDLSPTRP